MPPSCFYFYIFMYQSHLYQNIWNCFYLSNLSRLRLFMLSATLWSTLRITSWSSFKMELLNSSFSYQNQWIQNSGWMLYGLWGTWHSLLTGSEKIAFFKSLQFRPWQAWSMVNMPFTVGGWSLIWHYFDLELTASFACLPCRPRASHSRTITGTGL